MEFINDFEKFQKIIDEYNKTFQYLLKRESSARNSNKKELLTKLEQVELEDQQQKLSLQQQINEQLDSIRTVVRFIDEQEEQISDRKFWQFKYENGNESQLNASSISHSKEDISLQLANTVKSIEKITKSKMPKALSVVCSFFNTPYSKNTYKRVVENRQKLEIMLNAAQREVYDAVALIEAEINKATARKVIRLQNENQMFDAEATSKKNSDLKELQKLLLNGLEDTFNKNTTYKLAYDVITKYSSVYCAGGIENLSKIDFLMLGIGIQTISKADDGTLDRYLSFILQDTIYSNRNLLLPVALNRYLKKPVCIRYSLKHSDTLYSLFSDYVLQSMNIFSDIGANVYIVDCSNMGSKYSEFSIFEDGQKSKKVNIIRTVSELKLVTDALFEYIIETNKFHLRDNSEDIESYNKNNVPKRELNMLFISNISEISSVELFEKLNLIVKNGNRNGVITFIGIPDEEFELNKTTMRERNKAINALFDISNKIYINSDGSMSLKDNSITLLAPPKIKQSIGRYIVEKNTQNNVNQTIVPLINYMPNDQDFFKESCVSNVVIPIGFDSHGKQYSITLDKNNSSVLIAGNPSSGKSSLLHTMILQCITRYSPQNLELYLVDLKNGSEFNIYSQKGLKSIKVTLDDSEPDIAVNFLNYISSIVQIRNQKFQKLAEVSGKIVKNIEQFYKVNAEIHAMENIPRTLLIIDEFQSLYNSSRDTGEITNHLVRMCRTVGIHIIMASQRVRRDYTSNSFDSQTKEYFTYRVMFKLPQSGAKEIMPEQNAAINNAQTLRNGQMIINPNMGDDESLNQVVQCFYPDEETIMTVCEKIIAIQGKQNGIILNSERPVDTSATYQATDQATDRIIIGESNRLYYDVYNENSDDFIDNQIIALRNQVKHLIVCGNDFRVHASTTASVVAHVVNRYDDFKICILSSMSNYNKLGFTSVLDDYIHITESVEDFLYYCNEQISKQSFLLVVIINPYSYDSICMNEFSPNMPSPVSQMMNVVRSSSVFSLILCEDFSKLKNSCTYFDQEISCRLISVGSLTSMRSAMQNVNDRVKESAFNTIRPSVVKAYYYNKSSDKLGRVRLPLAEQIFNTINIDLNDIEKKQMKEHGYSGLSGKIAE